MAGLRFLRKLDLVHGAQIRTEAIDTICKAKVLMYNYRSPFHSRKTFLCKVNSAKIISEIRRIEISKNPNHGKQNL